MELCDKYLHELILINPTLNDIFQFEKYKKKKHIQPNVYSEKYYNTIYNLDLKYLRILKTKEKTKNDRILERDLKYNTKMEKGYKIFMYMPVNINNNILFDYVTECNGNGTYFFNSRNDYYDFMKRLKSLTPITEEIIDKMKNGIREKVCLPRKTVDKMIKTIQTILSNQTYKHTLRNNFKPKEWEESIQKYLLINLERFLSFLLNKYYIHTKDILGLCSYVGGKDAYRNLVQYETFDSISPEQIYQFGKKELNRLIKEKKRLSKKLNIKNIDKYSYSNEKDILNDLEKIKKKIQNDIFPKYFHKKLLNKDLYKIKKIKKENQRYFAYYSSKIHEKFQGEFYINTFNPKKVNRYELFVLSLHEGIPGHHYEGLTNYRNKNIPYYLKLGYNSYIEGWALYCENLGDYNDDLHYYFKIQYEINRSLRLLLDTGIHYFHWDYNKCKQYMKKYLTDDEERIHNDILRYMNDPGQAITYKIGEKAFLYFRNQLLKQGVSIKDIHQILFDIGPCPIEFLVKYF